jgi:Icc-related predicted phosphoesterase
MRICLTSDLHGTLPETPECDLLIIAGDVAPDFGRAGSTVRSADQQDAWLCTTFSMWLNERPGDPCIVGIAGNHDFALESDVVLGYDLPWHYLVDEGFEFEGVKMWGIPWVPNLSRWAFHLDDARLLERFNRVPDDTDIVISHGPPFGYCDRTVPKFNDVHAGFPGAVDMIDRVQPKLFVCGHIHEGYGYWQRGETTVCNVSLMTENYEPTQPPVLFKPGSLTVPLEFRPTKRSPPIAWEGYEDVNGDGGAPARLR